MNIEDSGKNGNRKIIRKFIEGKIEQGLSVGLKEINDELWPTRKRMPIDWMNEYSTWYLQNRIQFLEKQQVNSGRVEIGSPGKKQKLKDYIEKQLRSGRGVSTEELLKELADEAGNTMPDIIDWASSFSYGYLKAKIAKRN